ncbi:MAG: ROK family transcriptional regulator [Spirochaetota bacterium]
MTQGPLRSYDVRERNEKLVLQIIHRKGGISQSEVSQETGLKPPTVFRIFSQLESNGIIRECSPDRRSAPTKGRKPAFYCVVPESFYTIGIDFWAGSAAVVVVDFAGTAVHSEVVHTAPDTGAAGVMAEITALIERSVAGSGLDRERILGIGVGAPGIVDIESGTVVRYPRIPGLDGYGITEELSRRFGRPVHIHNNAAVIALGEYRYGSVQDHQSVMTFLIRSGVGGAFLQNGRILTNRGRTVLEVGHMVFDPNGPPCQGGRPGCLESYLSEGAVTAAVEKAGFAGLDEVETYLERRGLLGSDASGASESLFSELAEASSDLAETARAFAEAAHTLSNLLNPECYLIVSRYRWFSQFLGSALEHYPDSDSPGLSEGMAAIFPQTYDPIRACRGATDLVLDRFFEQ